MTRDEWLDELEYYGDIERPSTCPITGDNCYNDNCESCQEHKDYVKWLETH